MGADVDDDILAERGRRYGQFAQNTRRFWTLFNACGVAELAETHPEQAYSLLMVLVKASRLAHTVDDQDSWRDVIGYARLAVGEDPAGRQQQQRHRMGELLKVRAIAQQSGKFWAVEVEGYDGAITQTRRLRDIPAMAEAVVEDLYGRKVEISEVVIRGPFLPRSPEPPAMSS